MENNVDTYMGLDFGGTKLLIGEMDREGTILCKKQYATGYDNQQDAVKGILRSLRDYKKTVGFRGRIQAVGMGIVGVVDSERGLWLSMDHRQGEEPVRLAALLEEELGVLGSVNNDVRSATTAELMLGQGRYSKDFIYINVGTGLAAGVVANGRVVRGANYNAGEVGHMVVDLTNDTLCACGRRGCVENVVSGVGFTRQAAAYQRMDLFNQNNRAEVFTLFEKARAGDAVCLKMAEYGADTLACVIMNLVRVTDPDTVILGGGICNFDWFTELVKGKLNPNTMRGVTRGVVKASFSVNLTGLIGAASLGMLLQEKRRKRTNENYHYAGREAI